MNLRHDDLKTKGYVLRRTDYGEADRILNFITPNGELTAIARGVRKPKSKLAGGIELFTLSDINVHFGKAEMGTLTSARMIRYNSEIIKDLAKMELASRILRRVSSVTRGSDNPELFSILDQCLTGINDGMSFELVDAWCVLNLKKAVGEEMNLYRDWLGDKLTAGVLYAWNWAEEAFARDERGEFGADEIKVMRLMRTMKLPAMRRVKVNKEVVDKVANLVGRLNK